MKKLIYTSLLLISFSCSKHKDDIEATSEEAIPVATLELTLPAANTTYHNGDTVRFKGQAISTATIHGYDVYIRKAGDTTNLYYSHVHDHNDTINVDTWWVNDRAVTTDLEGTVVLALDHDGHTLKKTIPFRAQ